LTTFLFAPMLLSVMSDIALHPSIRSNSSITTIEQFNWSYL